MDLGALPRTNDKRVAVRVTKDAERQIRGGHPWVFDGSVESESHQGAPGDLAVVFDRNRKFLAIGLYDPDSPIRIRVLHAGSPRAIDQEFWLARLADAIDRRASLSAGDDTTAYRLINGENDGFPGLVLDRYADSLVMKAYSAAWYPHLSVLVELLESLLEPERLVLRLSRMLQDSLLSGPDRVDGLGDGTAMLGSLPGAAVPFRENGLTFEADIVHGQKTGHFLDQRDNRALVGGLAAGARVLDVFSCTGGFSVHAAAGGAVEVTSVDQSRHALETATRNFARNADVAEVAACGHVNEEGDAFQVMERLAAKRTKYDIVVIDPPSFAQRQRDVPKALNAYRRLTSLGLELVEDGGWLVQSSCSSRVSSQDFVGAVHDQADHERMLLTDAMVTGHALDHPISFAEGAYLKTVFARPRR